MWEYTIFGNSTLQLQTTVDKKAKKPCELPLEKDLAKLKDYLFLTINETVPKEKPTKLKADYILLRNATCARITLFNARGEPTCLLLTDLLAGLSNACLTNKQQLGKIDALETSLLQSLKVTYFVGKRNRLVPLILPKDSIKALQHLSSTWFRREAGIAEDNMFFQRPITLTDTYK